MIVDTKWFGLWFDWKFDLTYHKCGYFDPHPEIHISMLGFHFLFRLPWKNDKWADHETVYINMAQGFCMVRIYDEGWRKVAELDNLIVYPDARGRGYGDQLLRKAISIAEFCGCAVLNLWPDCEDWVKDWYRRNGFNPDEDLIGTYGEIGWCKALDLHKA